VRWDVAKLYDEHSSSGTVLRNPQQVDYAEKAALPRKFWRDISEADFEHLRYCDFAWRERVPSSDLHVRLLPQANRGRDLAAANAIANSTMELHVSASESR
jgi:hypothetical protein